MSEFYDKSWGHEEWLVNSDLYCGKILHINNGLMCSVHFHKLKDETFYVLRGNVAFLKNNKVFVLFAGDTIHIPINTPHCFSAIYSGGKVDEDIMGDAKIIEISTQHFEDDSYRVTKSGRTFDGKNILSFEESVQNGLLDNGGV